MRAIRHGDFASKLLVSCASELVVSCALVAGVIGCASAPPCPTYSFGVGRPFLWEASGPAGTMMIQATHQAVTGDEVSPQGWHALDASTLYVTEADEAQLDDTFGPDGNWGRAFFLPIGQTLRALIGKDDFNALVRAIDISVDEALRLKPWMAMIMLGREAYPFPEHTINRALLERARARKMPTAFLDTWEDQVAYLDAAITPTVLTRAINDFPNMRCGIVKRVAAFGSGEDAVFANDITSETHPIVARIDRWFRQLTRLAAGGQRPFVAVGIGQLVGPQGLLQKLAENGYTIRRL